MNPVDLVEKKYMDRAIPEFRPGDTVKVNVRIREGDKFRIQVFEGVVISIKRRGLQSTFTVRKVTSGYGVERVFPVYSPMIEGIERRKRGRVRRAKLYYLRDRKGKAARIREIR
jgi:large subunit ribosomal protein L19